MSTPFAVKCNKTEELLANLDPPYLTNQKRVLADRPRPFEHSCEWRIRSTCSLGSRSARPVCAWFTCSNAPEDPLKFNTVRWRGTRKWTSGIYRCSPSNKLLACCLFRRFVWKCCIIPVWMSRCVRSGPLICNTSTWSLLEWHTQLHNEQDTHTLSPRTGKTYCWLL